MTLIRRRRLPLSDLLLALATVTLLSACGGEASEATGDPAEESVPELEAVEVAPPGETATPAEGDAEGEEAEPTANRVNARAVLAAALAEAQRSDRMVFLHSGAPW